MPSLVKELLFANAALIIIVPSSPKKLSIYAKKKKKVHVGKKKK